MVSKASDALLKLCPGSNPPGSLTRLPAGSSPVCSAANSGWSGCPGPRPRRRPRRPRQRRLPSAPKAPSPRLATSVDCSKASPVRSSPGNSVGGALRTSGGSPERNGGGRRSRSPVRRSVSRAVFAISPCIRPAAATIPPVPATIQGLGPFRPKLLSRLRTVQGLHGLQRSTLRRTGRSIALAPTVVSSILAWLSRLRSITRRMVPITAALAGIARIKVGGITRFLHEVRYIEKSIPL